MVKETIASPDGMEAYLQAQTPEQAEICRRLVAQIRRCLHAESVVEAGRRADLGLRRHSQRAPRVEFEDRVLTRRRNSDRSGRTCCAHSPATRSDR